MTWSPAPWEHDGKFTVSIPIDTGEYAGVEYPFRLARVDDARLISLAPEMADLLDWFVAAYRPGEAEATRYIRAGILAEDAAQLLARVKGEA